MANETLSPKQAQQIIMEAQDIIARAKSELADKNNEFIEKVRPVWEDKNAVDFFKQHGEAMEQVQNELSQNADKFAQAVSAIAKAYGAVGGNAVAVSDTIVATNRMINVGLIKEFFDGDEFGFKNPEQGAAQVMDAFQTLKTSLQSIAVEAADKLKSINAFGNENVKANIAVSCGKVVEIVQQHIAEAEKAITTKVDNTAQAYRQTGSNAETAAKLQVSGSN